MLLIAHDRAIEESRGQRSKSDGQSLVALARQIRVHSRRGRERLKELVHLGHKY